MLVASRSLSPRSMSIPLNRLPSCDLYVTPADVSRTITMSSDAAGVGMVASCERLRVPRVVTSGCSKMEHPTTASTTTISDRTSLRVLISLLPYLELPCV